MHAKHAQNFDPKPVLDLIASIEADVDALARLGTEYERVQGDLDAAYERWEELSASLEAVAQ